MKIAATKYRQKLRAEQGVSVYQSCHNISETIPQWRRRSAMHYFARGGKRETRDAAAPARARREFRIDTRGQWLFFMCTVVHGFRMRRSGVIPYRQSYPEY